MLISWSPSAENDLTDIFAYFLSIDDIETGEKIAELVFSSVDDLLGYPQLGKVGRIYGTRELVLPKIPYIIIYEIFDDEIIEILRVFHTSRLYKES